MVAYNECQGKNVVIIKQKLTGLGESVKIIRGKKNVCEKNTLND